jgi:hypothetical protein
MEEDDLMDLSTMSFTEAAVAEERERERERVSEGWEKGEGEEERDIGRCCWLSCW